MDIKQKITEIGVKAKAISAVLATLDTQTKNHILGTLADIIEGNADKIKQSNAIDCEAAINKGLSDALVDRLVLNDERIQAMANGVRQVAALPDPIGEMSASRSVDSGLKISKMRTPIGVIGMIYESRPNVTIDAAILCFKSGNAAILRGGSEAFHSNMVLIECLQNAFTAHNLSTDIVQYIDTTDREAVGEMLILTDYIDVIIPRGSKKLVARIDKEAKVPVIKHLDGICHIYIDDSADVQKSIDVTVNAKTRRYGVCGSLETLLVNANIANKVLPSINNELINKGVEVRGCSKVKALIDCNIATEEDWHTEYLAPILSVKVVDNIEDAISHINHYGSHHTDSIMTESLSSANTFTKSVDSSSVMINASTQFADGFEYGLGAEIGISTNKLHVRGPVGLEALTTQKYIVVGDGHIRP